MRKFLPAAAIAVTLLTGCSHDSDKSTDVAGAAAPTGSSSLPPMFVPLPGASSGTTTGGGATGSDTTVPGGAATTAPGGSGTASPKPPSRLGAGIQALRTTWINATVTRSGPGSCYGMTSTDGTAYAVYLTQSVKLTTGTKVRAKVTPGKTAVDCGSGTPARSDRVQIAG